MGSKPILLMALLTYVGDEWGVPIDSFTKVGSYIGETNRYYLFINHVCNGNE